MHAFEERVLAALDLHAEVVGDIVRRDQHSNDLAEVTFGDGRVLVIKRARFRDLGERFRVSREAARLIRQHTDLWAPEYLDLPVPLDGEAVLAYWWLPAPTLADRRAGAPPRREVLRSWGRAVRRLHGIELAGHGPLLGASDRRWSLRDFLARDLAERLRPAVARDWQSGLAPLDRLARAAVDLPAAPATVVHNDLFDANILCEGDEVVGFLDFEDSFAGPPEADLAKTEVLHGPLFGQPLAGDWLAPLLEGYGRDPDPVLVGFFRAYHLANMGWYAAVTNRRSHADHLARVIAAELDALGTGRAHRAVVRG